MRRSTKPGTVYHPDRTCAGHTRIGLREQPFESFVSPPPPTQFLSTIFLLQSRTPAPLPLALLAFSYIPLIACAEMKQPFWTLYPPLGPPCFLFEPLLSYPSPSSDSPLLARYLQIATTNRTFSSPPLSYKNGNLGMSLSSTSKLSASRTAVDASARVASYLDPV